MSRWTEPPRCAVCGKPIDPNDCTRLIVQRVREVERERTGWKGETINYRSRQCRQVMRQQQYCDECADWAVQQAKDIRRCGDE